MTTHAVLAEAAARIGMSADDATPIRLGENAIYRLGAGVVVRIARPGQLAAARKEVAVSQWLANQGIAAVRALDVAQPIEAAGHPVTIWEELAPHRPGNHLDIADALRRLHSLSAPSGILSPLQPFVRLDQRIEASTTLTDDDRAWLTRHLARLRAAYDDLPAGLPPAVLHGDAYSGNIVVTEPDGVVTLLDLERFALGPPEWDLISTAIKRGHGRLTEAQYGAFRERYGHDVTSWPGYETLRDIRELRMTLYVAQLASERPEAAGEAALRVACIRGQRGPRPWTWSPV